MMAVKPCPNCKPHQFQDKQLGPKMRWMNSKKPKDKDRFVYVCTVCGKEAGSQ
jgi:hypothetical protein